MATTMEKSKVNTYDETPYHSYPYAQSRPEYLRTMGKLFGMQPPAVETARVLELGCAEGGNLIPHAIHYPKAKFVGVDLSKVQVDAGLKNIEKFGLKNVELKHMSITDIDDKFGEFDYIICHGVISWVPDFVRDKILEVSSKNLSKNGIAYISYNTLPGWNMVRTIRDMMLYHTKDFTAPGDKVSQARLLLQFVNDSLEGADTPYAKFLKSEADLLSKQNDHYLRHDHLEDDNKQFYFEEFMKEASSKGLQYLADCSLSSMYLGNMPQNAVEKLSTVNDIVRTEQYMDFITNRRFRSTLLCKNDVKLNRNLDIAAVKDFALAMTVFVEKPLKDVDINNNDKMKFYFAQDKSSNMETDSPAMKAVLYTFAENPNNPLLYKDLIELSNKKLKNDAKAEIEQQILRNAMTLVVKGLLHLNLEPGNKDSLNLDKPKLSKIALHQVTNTANSWVTSNHHNTMGITVFDKVAGKYMDGKNSKAQIVEHLLKDVDNKVINVNIDEKPVTDPKKIKESVTAALENTVLKFSQLDIME